MTKTTIKKDILVFTGGSPFIHISQLASMLRIGRDAARSLLSELEYVQVDTADSMAL